MGRYKDMQSIQHENNEIARAHILKMMEDPHYLQGYLYALAKEKLKNLDRDLRHLSQEEREEAKDELQRFIIKVTPLVTLYPGD